MATATLTRAAVAVFVKTPELSPVKTRLAADSSTAVAVAVYEESLRALRTELRTLGDDTRVYWAVGEQDGCTHPRWNDYPTLWTGDGGLGERLHHIYATLQKKHGRVILIGSDSPQLRADAIQQAARADDALVIGAAADGGFYLFAAARPLSRQTWCAVPYSRADTLSELLKQFPDDRPLHLPTLHDIDDRQSLLRVVAELRPHNPAAADRLAALAAQTND